MKRWLAPLTLLLNACTTLPEGITPVQPFEAERYLGTWYEIARLDHRFERGLEQVTAEYAAMEDGRIQVRNRGFDVDRGEWKEALGDARFVGESNRGHLGVSFFGPFRFSYVIFDLDPAYQRAYVTGHNRDYLWFLSRTPTVDAAEKQRFLDRVRRLGYAVDDLIWVSQQPTGSGDDND